MIGLRPLLGRWARLLTTPEGSIPSWVDFLWGDAFPRIAPGFFFSNPDALPGIHIPLEEIMSTLINRRHSGDTSVFRFCMGVIAFLSVMFLLSPSANAGEYSANYYGRGNSMQQQDVKMGIVVAVRDVVINTQSTTAQQVSYGAGALVGTVIGAAAGNGNGRYVAGAVGGVIGSLVGNAANEAMSRRAGIEAIIRFDDGHVAAFTQEADVQLAAGQKVFVIGSYSNARVVPAAQMR